jgi:hypothetical protein
LLAFAYWQLMPVVSASWGGADLKKLLAYPIPHGKLFSRGSAAAATRSRC